jgi:glycosyltransferase involved in cell wall biosynthesis
MLYYLPLENYPDRYTAQLAAPKTGWIERELIKYDIPYRRIDPWRHQPVSIKSGVALDSIHRTEFCFEQITMLLDYAGRGELTADDTILLDDFWTPGLEQIAYWFEVQKKTIPHIWSKLHAQSVDVDDFTYKMREWMRPIEKGYWRIHQNGGVFVSCPMLKELVVEGICDTEAWNVFAVGHPWSTAEVQGRFGDLPPRLIKRENKVVFSSRLDAEKNPIFMLHVAERLLREKPDATFVICSGAEKLRCEVPVLMMINALVEKFPNRFLVKIGLTKQAYYDELLHAKVQLNTSLQDWVSYTLLEASAAGCWPVYPHHNAFPEVLRYQNEFMYPAWEVEGCVDMIKFVMAEEQIPGGNDPRDFWGGPHLKSREWIHTIHDDTVKRMLMLMNLIPFEKDFDL